MECGPGDSLRIIPPFSSLDALLRFLASELEACFFVFVPGLACFFFSDESALWSTSCDVGWWRTQEELRSSRNNTTYCFGGGTREPTTVSWLWRLRLPSSYRLQVIVMKRQWKSHIEREPMRLLRPLPYYQDSARRLVDEQQARIAFGTTI